MSAAIPAFLSQALYLALALFKRSDGASTRKVRARERDRERLSVDAEAQGPEHPAAPNTAAREAVRESTELTVAEEVEPTPVQMETDHH